MVVVPSRITRVGLHHQGQFLDEVVDVLMEYVAPAAQQSIPVLHGHGGPAAVMVFDGCDPDELVHALKWGVEQRPVPDQLARRKAWSTGTGLARQDQLSPRRLGRLPDAGQGKTAFRIVDRVVGYDHRSGAGLQAQPDHFRHQLRMGGGAKQRRQAKAALTLISTRSPCLMKASMPPRDFSAIRHSSPGLRR